MQRTCTITDGQPEVAISGISASDQQALDVACDEFLKSIDHDHAVNLIEGIRRDLNGGVLSSEVIEKLSRWCDTGGPYQKSAEPARRISQLLLGFTLQRLIETDGSRVDDYASRIERLSAEINRGE